MARQTSIQLTEATKRQIEALKAKGFGSFTEIVRVAIDRMFQQEVKEPYDSRDLQNNKQD